ncbi:hypothetical protein ISN44_As12g022020 [Arabidopsis suecica]|uniref:Uncharacterized protein n=1 Tax=Arabidopsis suecica TaxID=45249 RepID=A0A8T1YLJ3_ARASU|nr:hypothetical protein ISN44_As12g022020 [Arabidopsis suecica]
MLGSDSTRISSGLSTELARRTSTDAARDTSYRFGCICRIAREPLRHCTRAKPPFYPEPTSRNYPRQQGHTIISELGLLSSEPTSRVARAVSSRTRAQSTKVSEPNLLKVSSARLERYAIVYTARAEIFETSEARESSRIDSNQEIFRKTPKNKESILIRDILSRLRDKWKSSENIAGEAAYHPYIKRLKALTLGRAISL